MNNLTDLREQLQEDIIAYMNPLLDREYEITNYNIDDLCQIVVDRVTELQDNLNDYIIFAGKKLKVIDENS